MKTIRTLRAGVAFACAAVVVTAAHALPAVQRSATAGDLSALPAVQSGWFMALLAQLQALIGA